MEFLAKLHKVSLAFILFVCCNPILHGNLYLVLPHDLFALIQIICKSHLENGQPMIFYIWYPPGIVLAKYHWNLPCFCTLIL